MRRTSRLFSKVASQRVESCQPQHVETETITADVQSPATPQQDEQLFLISGMSCAACVAKVEKAIRNVAQVEQVRVNLADNTAAVVGGDSDQISQAVTAAGYQAELLEDEITRAQKLSKNINKIFSTKSDKPQWHWLSVSA